jgi:DtxR family Mn-dependent transcriptional regulator
MITKAVEDYLKTIHSLHAYQEKVSTSSIAERLGVAQASVTGMLKKLAELKLVEYSPYHGVELTSTGKKIALEIIRHHRLLELYLAEAMGYSWDKVHDEAEKLEHFISEEFEDKMDAFLGQPTVDPHGAPIPTKEGHLPEHDYHSLLDVEPGRNVRILEVLDDDAEKLRYLGKIGLFPKCEFLVVSKGPFNGPIEIKLGENTHHLSAEVAGVIFVEEVNQKKS